MGRHTVGNKRGSVRGAPPDVYLSFGNLGDDDPDIIESVLNIVKSICSGLVLTLVVMFFLVVVYAFKEGEYREQWIRDSGAYQDD